MWHLYAQNFHTFGVSASLVIQLQKDHNTLQNYTCRNYSFGNNEFQTTNIFMTSQDLSH